MVGQMENCKRIMGLFVRRLRKRKKDGENK